MCAFFSLYLLQLSIRLGVDERTLSLSLTVDNHRWCKQVRRERWALTFGPQQHVYRLEGSRGPPSSLIDWWNFICYWLVYVIYLEQNLIEIFRSDALLGTKKLLSMSLLLLSLKDKHAEITVTTKDWFGLIWLILTGGILFSAFEISILVTIINGNSDNK